MDVQKPCVLVQRLENECRADRVEPRYRVELKERGLHAVLQGLNHQPEARYVNEGFASLRECQAPDVLEHVVVARLGRGFVSLPKNLRREVVRPVVPVASLRPTRRSWRGWGHWRGSHHGVNASDVQRSREGPPNSEAYRKLSKEERRRRETLSRGQVTAFAERAGPSTLADNARTVRRPQWSDVGQIWAFISAGQSGMGGIVYSDTTSNSRSEKGGRRGGGVLTGGVTGERDSWLTIVQTVPALVIVICMI